MTTQAPLIADETYDPLVKLAIASGCSQAAFTGIFGPNIDLNEYRGWTLGTARGVWTAMRGSRILRSPTLGGIYRAVEITTRKRSPTGEAAAYARSTVGMGS